jgi:hypothetical protein
MKFEKSIMIRLGLLKGISPEKTAEHVKEIARTSHEEAVKQGMVKDPDDLESPETRYVTRRAREAKAKKSYGFDMNEVAKSADLWNHYLAKGRKTAWQKEPKDEGDKEAMMPGRLMGDPGSREHERKRVGEIHESGRVENLKRIAKEGESGKRYAAKHGVKVD